MIGNNLVVYFGERKIVLSHKKPDYGTNGICIEITDRKSILAMVEEFYLSGNKPELFLWSENTLMDPVEVFLSLYRMVEAAGGVVRNEKGEFLFIYRYGKWDLPKGKISRSDKKDPGDGSRRPVPGGFGMEGRCALREVREETGLKKVRLIRELMPTCHIWEEKGEMILKRTTWFEMFATCDQPLIPQVKESITRVEWFPPNRIPFILDNTYLSLRDLILSVT